MQAANERKPRRRRAAGSDPQDEPASSSNGQGAPLDDAPPPVLTAEPADQPAPESAPRLRPPHSPTAVKVVQTERREFTDVVTPAPASSAGDEDEDEDEPQYLEPELPPGWDYVSDEDDQLRRFMSSIAGDGSDLRVAVKRLPDSFGMRGKFRTPCNIETQHGDIAFDANNLINNVRDSLGGGKYRLTIKNGSGRFITRPIELVIADPPGWQPPVTTAPLATNGKPEKPINVIDEIISQAAKFNQLRTALGFPTAEAATAPATPGHTDPKMLIAQSLVNDTGLVKEVIDSMLKSARKGDAPEADPWYKDVLMTFVKNDQVSPLLIHAGLSLITTVLETLKGLGGKIGALQSQGAATGQGAPLVTQLTAPPPFHAPASTPATQPGQENTDNMPDQSDAPPYLKVLDFIMQRLRDDAPVTTDETWVIELYERWPVEVKQAELMLQTLPVESIKLILVGIDPDYQETFNLPQADRFLGELKDLAIEKGKTT